jgi:hypothetical protein
MAKPGPLAALVEIVCAMLLFIAAATADSDVPITIRAYNTFGVNGTAFTSARAVAQRVLQLAGIQALWRECRTPAYQAPGDRCDDVLARNEIIVRVVRGPRFSGATAPLGDSLIERPGGGGVFATVFADRVLSAGSRTGADPAVLLGRAIAHEVGHLLIGAGHSSRGLMRAKWSDDELRRNRDRDWLFTPSQAERMKERRSR